MESHLLTFTKTFSILQVITSPTLWDTLPVFPHQARLTHITVVRGSLNTGVACLITRQTLMGGGIIVSHPATLYTVAILDVEFWIRADSTVLWGSRQAVSAFGITANCRKKNRISITLIKPELRLKYGSTLEVLFLISTAAHDVVKTHYTKQANYTNY